MLPQPERFINAVPHMSFVWGEENVAYLQEAVRGAQGPPAVRRASSTARTPPSSGPGRRCSSPAASRTQPIAATRIAAGTDVDFGALTHLLLDGLLKNGAKLKLEHRVTGLHQRKDGTWKISLRHEVGGTPIEVDARFVFVGAGGAALNLLQRSGIQEIRGYGGFPISGQFLRTDDPGRRREARREGLRQGGRRARRRCRSRTSTPASSTASASLLFGPYAGFTPKFLKTGSYLDLFASIRWHNLGTMIGAGLTNLSLVWYLVTELLATPAQEAPRPARSSPRARSAATGT